MLAVTGATGLTGQFLLAVLRHRGYKGRIRCLVRPTSSTGEMVTGLDIEYCTGDCADVDSLIRFLENVDNLIHLAGIRFAENIITACRATGLERVTFVNTAGIYSKYRRYASDYLRIENIIRSSGLRYTIIRPTMIYGNHRDRNIHKLVKIVNWLPIIPIVGKGDALVQPIHAQDLADLIVRAALDPATIGKEYDVGGKSPISYRELLADIAETIGKRRLFVPIPYWLGLFVGYVGEIIPNGLVNVERIQRLREDKIVDYSLARDELGFSPRSFREGVLLEVQALRKAGII